MAVDKNRLAISAYNYANEILCDLETGYYVGGEVKASMLSEEYYKRTQIIKDISSDPSIRIQHYTILSHSLERIKATVTGLEPLRITLQWK